MLTGVCKFSNRRSEPYSQESLVIETKGPNKVNPFTVPLVIANMACSNIAMMFGMQGKCFGLVSACATGTDSIGEAYHTIMAGQSDVMLAGGSDSIVCPQGISSFQQLTALTIETDPEKASIPFDKDRSGFVMGEGAGVLILEELEHARKEMLLFTEKYLVMDVRMMRIILQHQEKMEKLQLRQWSLH